MEKSALDVIHIQMVAIPIMKKIMIIIIIVMKK